MPRTSPLELLFSVDADRHGSGRRALARAAASGGRVRLARGAYADAAALAVLERRDRYIARIRAVAATRRSRRVVSHESAAALLGLPLFPGDDARVHLTAVPPHGGVRTPGVQLHVARLGDEDVVEIDGMLVTSLARTVLDLAASASRATAIAAADRVLLIDRFGRQPPMLSREQLLAAWERAQTMRARARALDVIEFASTAAESPLESESRWNMRVLGVPAPLLQSRFDDAEGFIAYVDFDWPDYGVLGEADGAMKYLAPRFPDGRTPGQRLLAEKDREDRLRALPRRVVRWRADVVRDLPRFAARLAGQGLPVTRPRR
ncbi:MAG: hypothetical protein QM635_08250 [Microbacteriaceae bacterium]